MLMANILLANRNHQHAMTQTDQLLNNLDQTRLDQAQLTELVESRLAAVEQQLKALQEEAAAEPAPPAE